MKWYFMLLVLFLPQWVHAQTKDGEVHMPAQYNAPYIKVTQVEVSGNKRTKDRIIIRELDFQIGDTLATFYEKAPFFRSGQKRTVKSDSSEVALKLRYSRENIINTKLFLMADLYLESITEKEYKLRIVVQERWYFWVFPIVKLDYPNFNDWLKDPDFDLVNTGIFTSHNNLWGLSHQGAITFSWGSSQSAGLGYYIPWVGNGKKIGLKMGAIFRNSAVVEYGSLNNERQILYNKGALQELLVTADVIVRPGLYNYGNVKLYGGYVEMSDSLISLATDYLPDNKTHATTVNLYADYYYDSRNNKAYPLEGNYLKVFIDKKGLGIISHDVDYFFYGVDFHFYQKINNKFYVAEMFKLSKSSSQNIPYYFKQTLTSGKDFIRGYDYYALRGDDMYYFRSNFKYELIKPGIKKARKEKHKDSQFRNLPYAFYLNTFADVGYLVDKFDEGLNPHLNKMLYTWGVGIDFISYYDLVLRFEYSFTILGTHGFFFGFGMPV